MAEAFPIPNDKLALFDIDGTIINAGYKITDPAIYSAVQEAQDAGWTLGLSSDSPYEGMQAWSNKLGMNGPIIAEKGALVDHAGYPVFDEIDALEYKRARDRLREHFQDIGVSTWEGNPADALRDEVQIGQPDTSVVLLNNQRRCSLSIFVRKIDSCGNITIDEDFTNLMSDEARGFYPPFADDLEEDLNHDHGLLIVARKGITKRLGTKRLMRELGTGQVAMVGNSIADYVGSDIALHYAVSNATEALKEKADYIAASPLTSGVVEILQSFSSAA